MPEAKLTETENGLVPDGDGWFVLSARDAPWFHGDRFGSACFFEGDARFPELGFNIGVTPPGEARRCTTTKTRRRASSSSRAKGL